MIYSRPIKMGKKTDRYVKIHIYIERERGANGGGILALIPDLSLDK